MGDLENLQLGRVTVLFGRNRGKYPEGNSLLVEGADRTAIIDPSLGVVPRRDRLPPVDLVLNSHCHEDHVAGNHLFPEASWTLHEADLPGLQSFAGFMAIFGFDDPAVARDWEATIRAQFHYSERKDALPFRDGDEWDLGGDVRIRAIHTPGHTRGHTAFWIEPEQVLFLGDIDLSSFGPYYGDAWSDLEAFERSLERVRDIEARHYATFHHVGVLGRQQYLERLQRFHAVIADREQRLLAYLREAPRSLDDVARHRFVYRPTDQVAFAEPVERRSMAQHLERLVRQGRVEEAEPGRFLAIG